MKGRHVCRAGLGLVLISAVAACEPTLTSHGYYPTQEAIERIQVGLDTRADVQAKLGRPSASGTFSESGWYYVSTQIEHFAYYEPEVVDRKVLAIQFDETDTVRDVRSYGLEDGRIVDLETRTTPTHGRELTILEQLIGNLSNIRGEDFFDE